MKQCKRKTHEVKARIRGFLFVLAALVCGVCSSAYAFNIPTGNEGWKLRWDNTIRYTLQQRLHKAEPKLIGDVNADDGDRNFDVGIVQNRYDLLSEADLIYEGNHGVRVSGAFWYDQKYKDRFDNDSVATSNHLNHGTQAIGLSSFADRYGAGPNGEWLDAFVFGKLDAGNVPVYLKAGRHTVMWGEVLFDPFNGINYGQAPIDAWKMFAQPGTEVKEIFRPLNQLSAVAQVSNDLTLAAQWYMQWERFMVPECGTYLSASDLLMKGSEILIAGPGFFLNHGSDITPNEFRDFGVSARWSPEMLHGGTLGFYYRNFSDKLPQAILDFADMTYRFAYASDIQVFGLSYANVIFGDSLGAEVSYRKDMPLLSDAAYIFSNADLPEDGETLGARGDTMHALVNYLGLLKRTPLWDAGSYIVEFDYSTWIKVTEHENLFKGRDGRHSVDNVTDDAGKIWIKFSPQWLQVLPGVDITAPVSFLYGLWGNSATAFNWARGEGMLGLGLGLDIFTKYKVDLNYVNYFGYVEADATGAVLGRTGAGGGTAQLRDRDFIALTFKTSF